MGPNGSGKSTLAYALTGHPKYVVSSGKIILDGKDITLAKPEERAKAGLFLSFQYPATVAGVTLSNFLRTAVNGLRESRGDKPYEVMEFQKLLQEKMAILKMDPAFAGRFLNESFSGGEKKRAEILQLLLLEPKYVLLDETDSGLDVDAIKTVAESIQQLRRSNPGMGIVLITHYHRFLDFLKPDEVTVIKEGRIVARGGVEVAEKIEKQGFENVG